MKKILLLLIVTVLVSCTAKKEKYSIGQIKTEQGEILFWLYDETPNHKASFIKLANEGYWDSLTFNRVVNNFVIQGGCPDTKEGFSDSPYLIKPEFNDSIRHEYGAIGTGRDNNPEKLSAGCQLYIVQNKEGLPRLDGDYMIFGKVFKGMDVVDAIATVKTDSTDTPLTPIKLDVNVLSLTADELVAAGFFAPLGLPGLALAAGVGGAYGFAQGIDCIRSGNCVTCVFSVDDPNDPCY